MLPIRGSVRSAGVPYVTVTLIAINVALFLYQLSLAPALHEPFLLAFGVVPARQTWALTHAPLALDLWLLPIFSSMFLHGGWLHLIGNMLFLWVFGDGVEARLGSARFLLFYLVAGVVASQAQYFASPASVVPMIGASGAIAGVLGGYLLLFPLATVTILVPILFLPLFFEVPALLFLIVWFLEQLFLGSISPMADSAGGVAWFAHLGGFAAGAVLVHLLKPPRRRLVRPPETHHLPFHRWGSGF